MHIDFTRSGGFAGMRLTCSVDTEDLPPQQGAEIHKLVNQSAFFELPEKLAPEQPQPDRFHYDVKIDWDDKSHAVQVSEPAAPDSLRPLLDYLTTLAITRRT